MTSSHWRKSLNRPVSAYPLYFQPLAVQPIRQQVRDLDIVLVREREVRVAVDADLGQVDQCRIPAMAIDRLDKEFTPAMRTRQLSRATLRVRVVGM